MAVYTDSILSYFFQPDLHCLVCYGSMAEGKRGFNGNTFLTTAGTFCVNLHLHFSAGTLMVTVLVRSLGR